MMSDPERMKRNAERTPEERKKRMAEVMTMQAKKYGFEDAKGFMAALKKYEDDDEVKELREQLEQFRKNASLGYATCPHLVFFFARDIFGHEYRGCYHVAFVGSSHFSLL